MIATPVSQKEFSLRSDWKNLFHYDFYLSILSGERPIRLLQIVFLYSVFFCITFFISYLPYYSRVQNLNKKVEQTIIDLVPNDVEITIKNGTATSNVTEPYYWTVSKDKLNTLFGQTTDKNTISKVRLLTIDTKGKAEDFENYQSYALLTGKNFVYYNDNKINITSLRDIHNLTVNKKIILQFFHDYSNKYHIFTIITFFIFAGPLFVLLFVFITLLLVYLYLAFLVFIMAKILGVQSTFASLYKYTLAITIIPTFIWELLGKIPSISPYTQSLDTVHTMLLLAICYIGLKKLTVKQSTLS